MGRRKAILVWLLCAAAMVFVAPIASADDGSSAEPTTAPVTAVAGDGSGDEIVDGTVPSDEAVAEEEEPVVREIVFPVVGDASYSAGFGACRDGCTRSHAGIDIMTFGWKGLPVVAAHDGTVVATRVGGELSGCSVTLASEDGWTTHYIHLNTDRPGTDEPDDLCFAPGVEPGALVPAGTLLGWVGDTGNAEETSPHLHFEIRDPEGVPVDPWLSLEAATRITHRWLSPDELPSLMASLFPAPQTTVRVVDAADTALLLSTPGLTRLEEPLVPFDAAAPESAITALEALAPERIIVLTSGTEPSYLDYLRTLAPIVATSDITPEQEAPAADATAPADAATDAPAEAPPEEAIPVEDGAVVTVHEAVASRYLVMVGSLGSGADPGLSQMLPSDAGDTPVVVAGGPTTEDVGSAARESPGSDANREGLWWMTADGWRLTDSIDERPSPGIALVDGRGPYDATVAYLVSAARAPQMPLWHHQPTSRASKSL